MRRYYESMLEEILALNRRAAAGGDFEATDQLLVAAVHAADEAVRLRLQSQRQSKR